MMHGPINLRYICINTHTQVKPITAFACGATEVTQTLLTAVSVSRTHVCDTQFNFKMGYFYVFFMTQRNGMQ